MIDEIGKYTAEVELSAEQPLIKQYVSMVDKIKSQLTSEEWKGFSEAKTDDQRVCFLLKELHKFNGIDKKGVDALGVETSKERIRQRYGKSDVVSNRYLEFNASAKDFDDTDADLFTLTMAVFYAESPEQKAVAFAHRCFKLKLLGLFDGCLSDAKLALELPCPEHLQGFLHMALGEAYLYNGNYKQAKRHFEVAKTKFEEQSDEKNLNQAVKGITECEQEGKSPTSILELPKQSWKCIRPPAPPLTKSSDFSERDKGSEEGGSEGDCKLLASPHGLLKPRYLGPSEGWTMEAAKDIFPGDILMVEKPFSISLATQHRSYCYYCFKRCHSLIPCEHCPHVGFCSKECVQKATARREKVEEGNYHFYDCHGMMPFACFCRDKDDEGDIEISHSVINTIGRVPPGSLIDYICSTGPYKGGSGHQAFVGADKVREKPPKVYDPMDYSSIAWLSTCSEAQSPEMLFHQTLRAIFLTYTLYLGGYPMVWFEETDLFYMNPTPINRPEIIPASWLAACILFHLQVMCINSFEFCELFIPAGEKRSKFGFCAYPTTSIINHSCIPNASVEWSDRGDLFVYAVKNIPAGSQVSICYGKSVIDTPRKERLEYYKEAYFFECKCEACCNNWDVNDGMPEKIQCPECFFVFEENATAENDEGNLCPNCKSLRGMEILQSLREKDIPWLKCLLNCHKWTVEDVHKAGECVKRAGSILKMFSKTLLYIEVLFQTLICCVYGLKVYEPWHT